MLPWPTRKTFGIELDKSRCRLLKLNTKSPVHGHPVANLLPLSLGMGYQKQS